MLNKPSLRGNYVYKIVIKPLYSAQFSFVNSLLDYDEYASLDDFSPANYN